MLLDANLLLYAVDSRSPYNRSAVAWLESVLNGPRRVALPWQTITAFMRIATNPRIYDRPLSVAEAGTHVTAWLDCDGSWIPPVGPSTWVILRDMLKEDPSISADLLSDAALAATALEHGLTVMTVDGDFKRLPCRSMNPLGSPGE